MALHVHLGQRNYARDLVRRYHYSHRMPSGEQLILTWHEDGGLFGDAGAAVAALIFATPATRWSQPVLELARLVRAEGVDMALSGLVSEGCKWAKKAGHHLLVSFADPTDGHHGGIYQACSWRYDGQASTGHGRRNGGRRVRARSQRQRFMGHSITGQTESEGHRRGTALRQRKTPLLASPRPLRPKNGAAS